ncbi:MAG: ATP-binding protein [Dehalococcoidia bacterium]
MPHGPRTSFGEQLRRYRRRAGLTQKALAERAGLTVSAISALEQGARRRPYPNTVDLLAAALDLGAEERAAFGVSARPAGDVVAAAASTPIGAAAATLPAPRTSLIGRERERATLRDLVLHSQVRMVTLTGLGGCGKTRLALQVAADLAATLPGGVRLVELAPVTDAALVPHAVAAAVGVGEAAGVPLLDTLIAVFRRQAHLLVLDNCEHLVDACAQLAEQLLDGCPALRILVTSREPLGVGGERQWRVPPLAVPDPDAPSSLDRLAGYPAVQLFVERAGRPPRLRPDTGQCRDRGAHLCTAGRHPARAGAGGRTGARAGRRADPHATGRYAAAADGRRTGGADPPADAAGDPGLELCPARGTRAGAVSAAGNLRRGI